MKLEKILKIAIGVGAVGLYFGIAKISKDTREFNEIYYKALYKYADINKYNTISNSEKEDFDRKLLIGKGVILKGEGWPVYSDGKKVETKIVSEWIKNYHPSE